MTSWYRRKADKVTQGDVYRSVPSIFIPSRPLDVVRKGPREGALNRFTEEAQEPPGGFRWEDDELIIAHGVVTRAVMLTHDCEIDKDSNYRLMALIRPWASLPPEAAEAVKENRRWRFFYLAGHDAVLPESYVDFRRITAVRPGALEEENRLLSMTAETLDALREALVRYLTRTVL